MPPQPGLGGMSTIKTGFAFPMLKTLTVILRAVGLSNRPGTNVGIANVLPFREGIAPGIATPTEPSSTSLTIVPFVETTICFEPQPTKTASWSR